MAYENLKNAIRQAIKQNNDQEITGNLLQSTLLNIVNTVGEGATFAGIATPTTDPGTPVGNIFYLAVRPGTYTNFNNIFIPISGLYIIRNVNSVWKTEALSAKVKNFFVNPNANEHTKKQEALVMELYLDNYNADGWLLATCGRNQNTDYDTKWTVQFYSKDLSKNIKFETNDNPEGTSGISLMKSGNSYIIVNWNALENGYYNTSQISDDYLITNDIIYSLDANPSIKTEVLSAKTEVLSAKTEVLFEFNLNKKLDDFSLKNGWAITDNKLKNSLHGIENRLLLNKSFTIDPRNFICDFSVNSKDGEVIFGTQRDFYFYGDGNMLVSVDFKSSKLKYYGKFKNDNIPNTPTKELEINVNNEKEFRFIISYIDRGVTIKLISLLSGEELGKLECENGVSSPPFVCYDKYFIYTELQSINICKLLITTKNYIGECKALIFGDSITYGQYNSIDDTWSYKLAKYLKNSFVSGLSGGQISQVLSRLTTECKSQIPQYAIVCIGTNGGNTTENLKGYIDLCKAYKSNPILCTTPQLKNNTGISTINQIIINVANANNIPVVRFDIATSLNYDISAGQDTSLFHDSVHPNAEGCKKMYNRLFVDVPQLIDTL